MSRAPFSIETTIADSHEVDAILDRLADEILAAHPKCDGIALVGIYTAGVPLSQRLQQRLESKAGTSVPMGMIDITLYRDDALDGLPSPVVGETRFDFPVEGTQIILVDDVLYTGRTVRAALDAVVDFGRPKVIKLLVLADRGHREFPIEANFVGVRVETSKHDSVKLSLPEIGDETACLRHFQP